MRSDIDFMRLALVEATRAQARGEVPVGAVIVKNDEVIARAGNTPIGLHDPSAHAEMLALRAASATVSDYRLGGATLYVTLEPCPMCAAALAHARIARLVFGAWDARQGAAGSAFNLVASDAMNHRVDALGGVLSAECGALLRGFFAGRR
jgi:tRNA(adenine34) deaminase